MGMVTDPAKLCDLFLRRSTLQDDKTTLQAHERDLRERAAREGLTVRKVWKEELSAFKAGVKREEFDNAIAAVLAGVVRHLLVWKLDRLSRRGMGQVGLVLDQFEAKGARLVALMDGLDSSIPQHRGLFAWLAEQARAESYNTSTRTRRTKAERKITGAWPGGQPPYGLRVRKGRTETEHHPKEYATARRIAEWLLANKATGWIAQVLNEEGLKTRRGGKWRSSTITQLAHSPAWAGLMPVHERYADEVGRERWRLIDEPLTGPDGEPVSIGTGVITAGERARILTSLRSRTSEGLANGRRGKPAAQSLLSGLLKCGRCGGNMTKGGPQYRCYRRVNMGKAACLGMTVLVKDADSALSSAFMARVTSFTEDHEVFKELARRWLAYQDPELDARRTELISAKDNTQARLDSLDNAYYVLGRFKGPQGERRYEQMREVVESQLLSVRNQLEGISNSTDLMILHDLDQLHEAWESADLEHARMLLRVVLHSVTLLPPPGQGRRSSWYQLVSRCCFHWVGEKPQPLRVDSLRLDGLSRYLPDSELAA
ncbi:recombinase family protein [Streptomyces corynorhini]|uniref:Recombinase family protein n=1 Tax=Streptomyces corynorhini TaxID=2282652 RepID=A0A370BFJ1_9ACTN|nr:recombinase family protein [Streptomyces corynorhini]RDG39442.1 recombinase family protein [Streptomyces corynorhini]